MNYKLGAINCYLKSLTNHYNIG